MSTARVFWETIRSTDPLLQRSWSANATWGTRSVTAKIHRMRRTATSLRNAGGGADSAPFPTRTLRDIRARQRLRRSMREAKAAIVLMEAIVGRSSRPVNRFY